MVLLLRGFVIFRVGEKMTSASRIRLRVRAECTRSLANLRSASEIWLIAGPVGGWNTLLAAHANLAGTAFLRRILQHRANIYAVAATAYSMGKMN
ncbi:MAG: hypothetical protein DMG38_24720 [Acidobacteria bacterium]|nr:MAG: hypothetical protein DMG38_24720 [Acidobacteriota bacterium]